MQTVRPHRTYVTPIVPLTDALEGQTNKNNIKYVGGAKDYEIARTFLVEFEIKLTEYTILLPNLVRLTTDPNVLYCQGQKLVQFLRSTLQ